MLKQMHLLSWPPSSSPSFTYSILSSTTTSTSQVLSTLFLHALIKIITLPFWTWLVFYSTLWNREQKRDIPRGSVYVFNIMNHWLWRFHLQCNASGQYIHALPVREGLLSSISISSCLSLPVQAKWHWQEWPRCIAYFVMNAWLPMHA